VGTTGLLVVATAVFLWCAVSARLGRADVTGPIAFVLVGVLLAGGGLVSGHAGPEALRPLVETALVWVLFSDAARVPLRSPCRRGTVRPAARHRVAADRPGRLVARGLCCSSSTTRSTSGDSASSSPR
jgi:hypothetical protein